MNKKGFTLVELIGVIILLSAIALISVPIINNSIKNTKEKTYNSQIDTIIKAAKRYVTEVGPGNDAGFDITMDNLINAKLIEDDVIIDPRDDSNMINTLTIHVTYDSSSKSYLYCYNRSDKEEENEC